MSFKKKPPTLASIKRGRKITDVNKQHTDNLTKLERLATWVSDRVGTPGFFLIIMFWTLSWLAWNILAPPSLKFDPVPACVFWLFISNMIQIFLMPLIMVAQNLQNKHTELRAERAFDVDKRTEQIAETILQHLEYQTEILKAILEKQIKVKT